MKAGFCDLEAGKPLYFFPDCLQQQEGFDCAVRAVNSALGFLLFSHRQQVVRLIQSQAKKGEEEAKGQKQRGGLNFKFLQDFAVSDKFAYSFSRIAVIDKATLANRKLEYEAEGRPDKAKDCNPVSIIR